tara:strand:- start:2423 stop:2734 length:312 start_codon:yes stop_codon:yes gene_type:complete
MPRAKKTATVSVKAEEVKDSTPEKAAPKPTRGRPSAAKTFDLFIATPSGNVQLQFKNERQIDHAFKQLTLKCASGRPANIICDGKEYGFCNISYVIRDEPVQQ